MQIGMHAPTASATSRKATQALASARVPAVTKRISPVALPAPSRALLNSASAVRDVIVQAGSATAERPATSAPARGNVGIQKPTVIITGASSGLGLNTAKALAASGDWHVVMAVRDYSKAVKEAKRLGFPAGSYTIMHLDLAALDSVRAFADAFLASGRRLDALVCNAAVYLPTAKEPTYTADGFELSVGTNHLGHFLLIHLLLEKLKEAPNKDPRCGGALTCKTRRWQSQSRAIYSFNCLDFSLDVMLGLAWPCRSLIRISSPRQSSCPPTAAHRCIIVGSITGNTNTLAGNVPPKANLGDLSGLVNKATMIDGGEFDGAKAYKDSKVCNMLTMRQLHQ